MPKPTYQISLLGILVLTALVAITIAFWKQRTLSVRMTSLEGQMSKIQSDYLKRSRFVAMIGGLDTKNESDQKTLKLAKAFTAHLSQIERLGVETPANVSALGKDSELIDADKDKGTLELLVLRTTMKFSPGWDQSIVGLYDADRFVQALPVETAYRTWHEVIIGDKNDDGVDDVTIQEYVPGDPTAPRQVTKESVYIVSTEGMTLQTTQNKQ